MVKNGKKKKNGMEKEKGVHITRETTVVCKKQKTNKRKNKQTKKIK